MPEAIEPEIMQDSNDTNLKSELRLESDDDHIMCDNLGIG